MMKKILFALLLFATPLSASDFLGTFKQYRNHIKRKLHIDTSNVSILADTTLNEFIREAVITNMPLTQADKVKLVDTTIGRQNAYALDTTLLSVDAVLWNKYDSVKAISYKPMSLWYIELRDGTSGKIGGYDKRPSFYDYDDDNLYLYPTPNITGDTIEIYGWRKVPDIAAHDSLGVIPQAYRPVIAWWATYLAADAISSPRAETIKAAYEEALARLNLTINRRNHIEEPDSN